MSKTIYIILTISIQFIMASTHEYPDGWNELQSNEGWTLIAESDRGVVYGKDMDLSPISAFRLELISDVSVEKLIETAWLIEKAPDIFPNAYITQSGIYRQISDTSLTGYQLIDVPVLAERLYQFNSIKKGNSIHWCRTDTLDSNFNPLEYMIPQVNFGSWEVQKYGTQSKLIYRICTDPGGYIPAWIVELANKRYLPLMLLDLEKYAQTQLDNLQ